jgi:RNA polymerase sigma factor (sigma-70 family)
MRESLGDEADLWRRAQEGGDSARERIANLAREIASREMGYRGAPIRDRADLVQESVRSTLAFLSSSREAPKDLRTFLKFRAWGVLSDHRKKMRSNPTHSAVEDELEIESGETNPERQAKAAQLRDALADCRARLVEEQRTVLAMRYEQHSETEAIASELGLHRNTVHVRVFRALESLRECMSRKGFDAGDLQ